MSILWFQFQINLTTMGIIGIIGNGKLWVPRPDQLRTTGLQHVSTLVYNMSLNEKVEFLKNKLMVLHNMFWVIVLIVKWNGSESEMRD